MAVDALFLWGGLQKTLQTNSLTLSLCSLLFSKPTLGYKGTKLCFSLLLRSYSNGDMLLYVWGWIIIYFIYLLAGKVHVVRFCTKIYIVKV